MLIQEFSPETEADLTGIKIAEVVSNEDPKTQERVLVRVVGVHNMSNKTTDNAVWANHCSPYRNASGDLPEAGDYIYVMFPNPSDPMAIIWMGFVRSSFQNENKGTKVTTPLKTDIFGEVVEL